jgi:tetratricopeptide (TPR) repeat protein
MQRPPRNHEIRTATKTRKHERRPIKGFVLSCFRGRISSCCGGVLLTSVVLQSACGSTERASLANPGRGLQPVSLPDVSQAQGAARSQLETRQAALLAALATGASDQDLAREYGETGKLLMAATDLERAEPCLLNAQTLAPADFRWPYYLGHVYRIRGPLPKAVESFEQVLKLRPDDFAALVWLGEMHLSEGRPDLAAALFAKALAARPDSAAGLFGAGRAELANRDYGAAAKHLEAALAREPRATAVHYPLAMAYRGLGDVARAEQHLKLQGTDDPRPADPLMREIDDLVQSPEAYNVRGGQALDAGQWAQAAEHFRKGLAIDPADVSLRHRLGTALAQMGDVTGAATEFDEVIRRAPDHARAHFSLGVLLANNGRHDEAIARFTTALKHEPGYAQARVQLAGALARNGRPGEAIDHFRRAIEADPRLSEAVYGRGMALVRLGRFREARDAFADGAGRFADQPLFKLALARVLAAAPDDQVRDGRRAMAIVDEMMKGPQSIELAETAAMGLAEVGRFDQAIEAQRSVLEAARSGNLEPVVRRATENLQRYEKRQPCRRPFTEDELP